MLTCHVLSHVQAKDNANTVVNASDVLFGDVAAIWRRRQHETMPASFYVDQLRVLATVKVANACFKLAAVYEMGFRLEKAYKKPLPYKACLALMSECSQEEVHVRIIAVEALGVELLPGVHSLEWFSLVIDRISSIVTLSTTSENCHLYMFAILLVLNSRSELITS